MNEEVRQQPMTENSNTRDLLARQYEYFQYLFEQEQKRATSIVGGAKVYIAFLVFIMTLYLSFVLLRPLFFFLPPSLCVCKKKFKHNLINYLL